MSEKAESRAGIASPVRERGGGSLVNLLCSRNVRPTKCKCSFQACLYASPSGSDQACP